MSAGNGQMKLKVSNSRLLRAPSTGALVLTVALMSLGGCEIASRDAYEAPTPSIVETVLSRRSGSFLHVYYGTSRTTIRTGDITKMRSLLGKLEPALTPCEVLPNYENDDEPIADILVQTGKDPFQFFVIGYQNGRVLYRLEETFFIGGRETKMAEFLNSVTGNEE